MLHNILWILLLSRPNMYIVPLPVTKKPVRCSLYWSGNVALVVTASGASSGKSQVLVDNELASARVAGSEDSKANDDTCLRVSLANHDL